MKYAGIGSQQTPQDVRPVMQSIGRFLARNGHILRSGCAAGADTAFEIGAKQRDGQCELFTEWDSIRPTVQTAWFDHAAEYHPAWEKCGDHAARLHARNSAIMLGPLLNDPVNFVVCWTRNGGKIGGTGQALRIADAYKIPVFNLQHDDCINRLRDWLINNG